MSIDKVSTKTATSYVAARRKASTKFSVDGIAPVDKPPPASDEASRGRRDKEMASRASDAANSGKETQDEGTVQEGRIDERI